MRTLIRVFLLGIICLPLMSRAEKTAPPAIDFFTDSVTTGCPPLQINFVPNYFDQLPDLYVSWLWDFGDGTTSTDYSPLHTFSTVGDFTVSLVLTKQSGHKDTVSKVGFVKTTNSFTLDLGPDKIICSGGSAILNATVAGATGYLWEDGTTTASVERFFEGEYSVEVTKGGCVARDTIYVTSAPSLSADFDYSFTPGCSPISTTFTEMSQSCTGTVNEWSWDFGDGSPLSSDRNPIHDYSAPGDYLVTLTVKNSIGSVYATNKTVTIEGFTSPTVQLGDDIKLCEGFDATLVAAGTGDTYIWNTGATSSSIVTNTSGKYYVTVTLDGCTASDTVQVDVLPDLLVDFSATQLSSCLPMKFKYTDKTKFCESEVDSWHWDFGDGTTSNEQNPEHTFNTAGQFPVRLTIMLKNYISSDKMRKTLVNPIVFNVDLGTDTTICEGETVILDADAAGMTYEWNTGETTQQIEAVFDGEYSIRMTYQGCEAKDTIVVTTQSAAAVHFGYQAQGQCLPVSVAFSDSSALKCGQTITSWSWQFGDGEVSNEQNPTHVYHSADSFVVRLTVTTSGGSSTSRARKVGVTNTVHAVNIPNEMSVCAGSSAQLDAGIDNAAYSWYPSAGLDQTNIRNPVVQPPATGWYYVDVTKCMVTVTDSIYVIADSVPRPVIVQDGNTLKTSSSASDYEWYRDGIKIPGATGKTVRLDYQGYYFVRVFNSNGCEKESATAFYLPYSGKEKGDEVRLKITPNPATDGVINIIFSELPGKPARVTVYDLRGAKVMTAQVNNHRNPLYTRKLAKGMYLVEVIFDKKRVTLPVVVQ